MLDAMSCGRPAYVYDAFGGDGWVTADTYDAIEADAIAGQAVPDVIDGERLRKDLAAYDPDMGRVNRHLILKHHGARSHVHALVELCEGSPRGPRPGPGDRSGRAGAGRCACGGGPTELIGLRAAVPGRQRAEPTAVAQHAVLAAQAESATAPEELPGLL